MTRRNRKAQLKQKLSREELPRDYYDRQGALAVTHPFRVLDHVEKPLAALGRKHRMHSAHMRAVRRILAWYETCRTTRCVYPADERPAPQPKLLAAALKHLTRNPVTAVRRYTLLELEGVGVNSVSMSAFVAPQGSHPKLDRLLMIHNVLICVAWQRDNMQRAPLSGRRLWVEGLPFIAWWDQGFYPHYHDSAQLVGGRGYLPVTVPYQSTYHTLMVPDDARPVYLLGPTLA